MPYRQHSLWKKLDICSVAIYLILVITGWFSIYAASYDFGQTSVFDFSGRAGMQMIWIITSLMLALALLLIESAWYEFFAYWIYSVVLILLIATLFLATMHKGSGSWIEFGPIRFQPAEFAKFATALAVARFIGNYKFELKFNRQFFILCGLFIVPMLLIIMQNETGSALVFFAFFLVLYREGMSGHLLFAAFCAIVFFVIGIKYGDTMWGATPVGEFVVLLLIIICANGWLFDYKKGKTWLKYMVWGSALLMIVAVVINRFVPFNLCWAALGTIGLITLYLFFLSLRFWALPYIVPAFFIIFSVIYLYSVNYVFDEMMQPHQQMRIKVFLGMVDDPRGVGYNVNQAKIAIGSGGIFGKGFLNGTQTKLKYVPEQDTDFIFCTVGEEKGFVGTTIVLSLFLFLIIRLIWLAERQRSTFCRVYGYCTASILFFHLAVNVGMVIGITPVIGIPLPFFSYGGSSLWAFTTLLFIFLRFDAARSDSL